MNKKKSYHYLFGISVLLSITFSFVINTSASENLKFSNAELKIDFAENEFIVNGSFESASDSNTKYMVVLAAYDFDDILESVSLSEAYPITEGVNTISYNAGAIADAKKLKAYAWTTDDMTPICEPAHKLHRLRVLAIGNSFSVDAMEFLYKIAKDQGVDDIVLGNLYIGSCTLETHWTNASGNLGKYKYYKNNTDEWRSWTGRTMLAGIQNVDWDFITLQQASGSSGKPETYEPYLSNLIEYINKNKTNPDAKILWHMTWAYQQDSTHSAFPSYNSDQLTMYNAIVNAVKTQVYPHSEIAFCIPTGTVIQNARTTYYGDKLTRDGYHLGNQQGRYIAGLTWYYTISGMPIDNMTYAPNNILLWKSQQITMRESIENAVLYPEKVTQSKYTDQRYCYDFENDYIEINWEPKANSYWNSTSSASLSTGTTDAHKKHIASKKFAKNELPNGTVILVDTGYQYRPEGWQTENTKNSDTRPAVKTSWVFETDDSWWGTGEKAYHFRAFNISATSGADISGKTAEAASHFRIYVPKK